jgi:hypothetical protein
LKAGSGSKVKVDIKKQVETMEDSAVEAELESRCSMLGSQSLCRACGKKIRTDHRGDKHMRDVHHSIKILGSVNSGPRWIHPFLCSPTTSSTRHLARSIKKVLPAFPEALWGFTATFYEHFSGSAYACRTNVACLPEGSTAPEKRRTLTHILEQEEFFTFVKYIHNQMTKASAQPAKQEEITDPGRNITLHRLLHSEYFRRCKTLNEQAELLRFLFKPTDLNPGWEYELQMHPLN